MKAVIVDDESGSLENLRLLIKEHCPDLRIVGEANGVGSAYTTIKHQNPDVIFLDISMKDGTGFDLLDKFDAYPFQVVFQTASSSLGQHFNPTSI